MKAYIDTTVLTDGLLKSQFPRGRSARAALRRYSHTSLPEYAIKEFKRGPLAHFVWLHNKLSATKSLAQSLQALHRISYTPKRNWVSTAIEAAATAAQSSGIKTTEELRKKYGDSARQDFVNADQFRLALKARIFRAWHEHKSFATEVTDTLTCYQHCKPLEENGIISLKPDKCNPSTECCMGPTLRRDHKTLQALKNVADRNIEKPENKRRSVALASLISGHQMSEKVCTDLGDAIFAYFAPQDHVILTTNVSDHAPLAAALNKRVETP